VKTGHVIWERTLIQLENVRLTSPIYLGTDAMYTLDGKSVVVLCDGMRVMRLSIETGEIEWSLDAPGAGYVSTFISIT